MSPGVLPELDNADTAGFFESALPLRRQATVPLSAPPDTESFLVPSESPAAPTKTAIDLLSPPKARPL